MSIQKLSPVPLMLSGCLLAALATTVCGQSCTPGANASVVMDGVDDWIHVPDNAALDAFGDFTIEFWVLATTNLNQGLVSKYRHASAGNTDDAYSVRVFPPGVLRIQLASGGSTSGTVDGATIVADGTWRHVAVTRSGSMVSSFVDGQPDTLFSFAGPLNATDTPLALGALLDPADSPLRFLGGRLDEVRLWNLHRTQTDIQQGMSSGLSGAEAGLVGYWRLDDGVGQAVTDTSSTGASGTLGATGAVAADDPAWTEAFPSPMAYCGAIGGGQANTPEATLRINGVGTAPATGPFAVGVQPGTPISLSWEGAPGAPIALVAGPLNGGFAIPGFGSLDVGTPPTLSDLLILFNGFEFPGILLFVIPASGSSEMSFTAPFAPPGTLGYVQGVVGLVPGPGMRPTAAFRVDVL